MPDLTTTYMGMTLRNPLVVASSSLSGSLDGVKNCAAAGAGAIVLKSLFEEQISAETNALSRYSDHAGHGEATEYLQGYSRDWGPRSYLKLVEDAKKSVAVPIIASLNCRTPDRWVDYARKLEVAGADAVELNIAIMPLKAERPGVAVEDRYLKIVHEVKSRVSIPVAVKIGPYFSSFSHFAKKLCSGAMEGPEFSVGWCGPGRTEKKVMRLGADALVLFNRFYQLDIDIDKMQLVAGNPYSTSAEIHTSLRWISLLAGRVAADLAATTGVHDSTDVVKQLLAGACVVQLCSTLYRNGLEQIAVILDGLNQWMQAHDFAAVGDFRGILCQARSRRPANYERLQYIKLFVGVE
jgi:dihydroorotate dehydrogenase (fumarate)